MTNWARVEMKDGCVFPRVDLNGSGVNFFGPDAGRVELHGTLPDGSFFCEFEDAIKFIGDPKPDTVRQPAYEAARRVRDAVGMDLNDAAVMRLVDAALDAVA